MQQRQPRLGDILDDYCPRERRVTNHAVVAMVGAEIKQTRCTTCDAEHEYKAAKVPPQRRKKPALFDQVLEAAAPPEAVAVAVAEGGARGRLARTAARESDTAPASAATSGSGLAPEAPDAVADDVDAVAGVSPVSYGATSSRLGDGAAEGPVHRRLIRATLPRTEGTIPTRQIPEFTIRQTTGRGGPTTGRGGPPTGKGGPPTAKGGKTRPGGSHRPWAAGPQNGNERNGNWRSQSPRRGKSSPPGRKRSR